jgi:hypothetical protein
LLVVLAAVPVLAQSGFSGSANMNNRTGVMQGSVHITPPRYAGPVVAGAPYSAQRVSEHVLTTADGTKFTTSSTLETEYRDSLGRTRKERPIIMAGPGANVPSTPLLVEIRDPVTQVGYTFDTQSKVAHRMKYDGQAERPASGGWIGGGVGAAGMTGEIFTTLATGAASPPGRNGSPAMANRVAAAQPAAGERPHPEFSHEDLGTQSVEGVTARGTRYITTWPAGSQGSDRPFQTVSETWYSDDLKLTVLTKTSDPRSGESTTKMININRVEPDASLFTPPPDYTVVDENGPFSIPWTGMRTQ